ncbi:MAG: hypothetical protein RIF41_14230, partial [Polyangiaceae bacterium]
GGCVKLAFFLNQNQLGVPQRCQHDGDPNQSSQSQAEGEDQEQNRRRVGQDEVRRQAHGGRTAMHVLFLNVTHLPLRIGSLVDDGMSVWTDMVGERCWFSPTVFPDQKLLTTGR